MSTTRKILLSVGVVVLGSILYLAIRLKSSDKQVADFVVPELQVASMQVTNLTPAKADINMSMVLDNPAPVGLKIDSLQYVIRIEEQEVARSTYPDSLRLEASDSTAFSLPVTVYHTKLRDVLDKLEKQGFDSVDYKVNATIFTDMAVIPKDKLNLEIEKRLPLVYPPDIKVTDIKVEDVGLKGATMQTEMLITNKNAFRIGFRDMAYAVQLDNNEPVEGNKPGIINIPANSTTTVRIPAELDLKGMGKNIVDLIRKGDDVTYTFNMKTELVSNSDVLKNSEINLKANGQLKEAIAAAKALSGKE